MKKNAFGGITFVEVMLFLMICIIGLGVLILTMGDIQKRRPRAAPGFEKGHDTTTFIRKN